MDITIMMELPYEIKEHIIDYNVVSVKANGRIKGALRVVCDKILTEDEKNLLKNNKHVLNVNGIAQYKHAPEIQHSYFYILY